MTEGKSNDVVLSVKDLHVYFYTNQRCNKVLRGVSFDIRRGRISWKRTAKKCAHCAAKILRSFSRIR